MAVYQKLLPGISHKRRLKAEQQYYSEEPSRAKLLASCVWCGDVGTTKDHLVPQWFLKAANHSQRLTGITRRKVPSCQTCNNRKSGMPAAVFARLPRGAGTGPGGLSKTARSSKEWSAATKEWSIIISFVTYTKWGALPQPLKDYLIESFSEMPDLPLALPPEPSSTKGQRRTAAHLHTVFNDERSRATLAEVWPSASVVGAK